MIIPLHGPGKPAPQSERGDAPHMIAILEARRAGLLAPRHWLRNALAGVIVGVVLAGRSYASLAGALTFISEAAVAKIVAFAVILVRS